MAGLYFTAMPNPDELKAWEEGAGELKMNDARQRLAQREACRRYPGLMGDREWVANSFRQLNGFSHGKPSTANIEFWEGSNGPIYVARSFEIWKRAFVDVILLVVLLTALAEPRLPSSTYPADFNLTEFIETLLAWHPDPPAVAYGILRDLTAADA